MKQEYIVIAIILMVLVYFYLKSAKENFDAIQARFDGCKDSNMKNSNIFKITTPDVVSIDECKSLALQGNPNSTTNIIFGMSEFRDNKAKCHYNYDTTMVAPTSATSTTCTTFENFTYGGNDSIAMYTLVSNSPVATSSTTPLVVSSTGGTPVVVKKDTNDPIVISISSSTPVPSNSNTNSSNTNSSNTAMTPSDETIQTPSLEQTNAQSAQSNVNNMNNQSNGMQSLNNANVRSVNSNLGLLNAPMFSAKPVGMYENTTMNQPSSINHVMPMNSVDLMSNNATLDSYSYGSSYDPNMGSGESLVKQIGFKGVSNIYAPIITL